MKNQVAPTETTEPTPTAEPKEDLDRPYKDLTDSELDELLSARHSYSAIGNTAAEKLRSLEVKAVEKEIELRKKTSAKPTSDITEIKTDKDTFYKKPGDPNWYRNLLGTETIPPPILIMGALKDVYPDTYHELKEYKDAEASLIESGRIKPKQEIKSAKPKIEPTPSPKVEVKEEIEEDFEQQEAQRKILEEEAAKQDTFAPIPTTELSDTDIQEELAETEVTEA